MTHEQQLREQRQALNAAINNRDVDQAKAYLHPDYACKTGQGCSVNREAMVQQMEGMLQSVKDFKSHVEVEQVEVEGDRATLLVSRGESGRIDNPPWMLFVVAAVCLAVAVRETVRGHRVDVHIAEGSVVTEQGDRVNAGPVVSKGEFDVTIGRVQGHLLNASMYTAVYLVCVGWAFSTGRRSFHTAIRARETWRHVDGRWLVAEEELLDAATTTPGREYKSKVVLLGLPLVHVAYGRGVIAKGWIAVGDTACGVLFAAGAIAVGGIAVGGLSVGVVSLAGVAAGVFAFGGAAVGGWAMGGVALGVFAIGGAAIAWKAAAGGLAVAHEYAMGGGAFAAHANDVATKNYMASSTFFRAVDALMSFPQYVPWLLVLGVPLLILFCTIWRAGKGNEGTG